MRWQQAAQQQAAQQQLSRRRSAGVGDNYLACETSPGICLADSRMSLFLAVSGRLTSGTPVPRACLHSSDTSSRHSNLCVRAARFTDASSQRAAPGLKSLRASQHRL